MKGHIGFHLYKISRIGKSIESSRLVVATGLGCEEEGMESNCIIGIIFYLGVTKMF